MMSIETVFKLRKILLIILVVAMAAHYGVREFIGNDSGLVFITWLFAAGSFSSVIVLSAFYKCKQCGKRFFQARFYTNPFASRCVHCKNGTPENDL